MKHRGHIAFLDEEKYLSGIARIFTRAVEEKDYSSLEVFFLFLCGDLGLIMKNNEAAHQCLHALLKHKLRGKCAHIMHHMCEVILLEDRITSHVQKGLSLLQKLLEVLGAHEEVSAPCISKVTTCACLPKAEVRLATFPLLGSEPVAQVIVALAMKGKSSLRPPNCSERSFTILALSLKSIPRSQAKANVCDGMMTIRETQDQRPTGN